MLKMQASQLDGGLKVKSHVKTQWISQYGQCPLLISAEGSLNLVFWKV